jgi:hypothetical protein
VSRVVRISRVRMIVKVSWVCRIIRISRLEALVGLGFRVSKVIRVRGVSTLW